MTFSLQHERRPGLPLLIIGAMSLLGGALTILLPETSGVNLPQTLLDGDLLGRGSCLPRRGCLRLRGMDDGGKRRGAGVGREKDCGRRDTTV